MSGDDPQLHSGEAVAVTLTVDGEEVGGDRLVSVETWSEANRIPRARVVLFEGPDEDGKAFPVSTSATFLPGSRIVIAAGYGAASRILHSGTIVRHSIRVEPGVSPQLVIESADKLLAMTLSRNSAVNTKKSDKDVIAALVAAAGGSVGKNKAASTPHEALVQFHASDWDLLLLRAEAGGCVALVEDGKVDIVSPTASAKPAVTLTYGDDIVSLEATLDATAPLREGAPKSRSWDYGQQSLTDKGAESADVTAPGNFGAAKLAKVFEVATAQQQSGALLAETELTAWSTAALMRSRLAAVQGSAQFQGTAEVKPGSFVALEGVGPRFEGNAFLSSVRHVLRGGAWQTIVRFGMAAEAFASRAEAVAAPPAAGLVPPVRGLHIGQVKQVATDPAGNFRVLATLPLIADGEGVWARLAQFYASAGFGAAFYPEVGDEVVLGFMDEDPANPVILGSVYSSQRAPTHSPEAPNDLKSLVTRSKMEISFDDKQSVLEIKTADAACLVRLDQGKDKEVRVKDPFGNYIVMTKDKVDVHSGAKLNLSSVGDMTIDAGGKLEITAKGKYSLTAMSIEESAKTTLSITASATGKLKTTGPLTIAGAMVDINPPGG